MLLNSTSLTNLGVGFKTHFQNGLAAALKTADWTRVATKVTSTTREEEYGWLGEFPEIREWVGERVIKEMEAHRYSIRNIPFESTIGVDRDDIEDDNLGLYAPMFQTMGDRTANFPNKLVFNALAGGFDNPCYDGQPFFDTDHPLVDSNGVARTVSNFGGGAGTPWYLLCTRLPLKPIVYQERKAFDFVAMDKPDDEEVFNKKKIRYGVDGRSNVGYGFWQFAYSSKETLNADNFEAAMTAFAAMAKDAAGEPLGIKPDVLVVPESLKANARGVLKAMTVGGGNSNIWYEAVDLLETAWL